MVEDHVREFHQYDEEIRAALWGSMRSLAEGGGRRMDEGIVYRVAQLEAKKQNVKIAASDKLLLAALLAIIEVVRWING